MNPDKLALLERWMDQAALAFKPELRAGNTEREDYADNRIR